MKKVSMKIVVAAFLIAAGTFGLEAQTCSGTGFRGNRTGTCINSTTLTAEQKAQLAELATAHQAEMATLREQMLAATSLADKLAIRKLMADQREAHWAEVKALFDSWGIVAKPGSKKGNR